MSTKSKNGENTTTNAKVWHKPEELKCLDHHHEWRCHIHTKSENKTITKHDVNFKPYKPNPKQSSVNHINNAGAHLCSNGSHATCARWNDLDTLRIWKPNWTPTNGAQIVEIHTDRNTHLWPWRTLGRCKYGCKVYRCKVNAVKTL